MDERGNEIPADWDSEVCQRCGQHSVVGFGVADDVWERVVEGRWQVLCLRCFDILADPKDVAWEAACSLYATSTATARRARAFEAVLNARAET